jgi:hypothetical protein
MNLPSHYNQGYPPKSALRNEAARYLETAMEKGLTPSVRVALPCWIVINERPRKIADVIRMRKKLEAIDANKVL